MPKGGDGVIGRFGRRWIFLVATLIAACGSGSTTAAAGRAATGTAATSPAAAGRAAHRRAAARRATHGDARGAFHDRQLDVLRRRGRRSRHLRRLAGRGRERLRRGRGGAVREVARRGGVRGLRREERGADHELRRGSDADVPDHLVAGAQSGKAIVGFQGMGTDGDLDPEWWMSSGGADFVTSDAAAGTLELARHVFIATPPEHVHENDAYDFWNLGRKKVRQVLRIAVEHASSRQIQYGTFGSPGRTGASPRSSRTRPSAGGTSTQRSSPVRGRPGRVGARSPGPPRRHLRERGPAQAIRRDPDRLRHGDRHRSHDRRSLGREQLPAHREEGRRRAARRLAGGHVPASERRLVRDQRLLRHLARPDLRVGLGVLGEQPGVPGRGERALLLPGRHALDRLADPGIARRAPGEPKVDDVFQTIPIPSNLCWEEAGAPICAVYSIACDPADGSVWVGRVRRRRPVQGRRLDVPRFRPPRPTSRSATPWARSRSTPSARSGSSTSATCPPGPASGGLTVYRGTVGPAPLRRRVSASAGPRGRPRARAPRRRRRAPCG